MPLHSPRNSLTDLGLVFMLFSRSLEQQLAPSEGWRTVYAPDVFFFF